METVEMKAGLLAKKQARKIVYSADGKIYLMFVIPSDPYIFVSKQDHSFPRFSVLILVAAPNGSSLSMNEGGAIEIYKEGIKMSEVIEPFSESYAQVENLYENYVQADIEQKEALKKLEADKKEALDKVIQEMKNKESGIILPPEPGKIIIP